MAVYLKTHPNPHHRMYREGRRVQVSGAIVVHTAENAPDLVLPDHGAEGVARWIGTRDPAVHGYGSYHDACDSDSIVNVVEYSDEAYGEGTGGNRWALHLSAACQAHQWGTLPHDWVRDTIVNMAAAAADMADYVRTETGIVVPVGRITPAQYRARQPGFIGHGELDPGRRSDPGDLFPWAMFLAEFARLVTPGHTHITPGLPPKEPAMPDRTPQITAWQNHLVELGFDIGNTGPNGNGVDGDFGNKTLEASMLAASQADDSGIVDDDPMLVADAQLGQAARALLDTYADQGG